MMKLRINPLVAEDLKNTKEYIAENNEEMAAKTIYKYAISGNYVVLYRMGDKFVEIYRVVNRYQDITQIF